MLWNNHQQLTRTAVSDMVSGVHDDHGETSYPNLEDDISEECSMILQMVSGCIGSLFKIGILVRKLTTRDRFERALQQSEFQFPPDFDIQHVREKFPKTSPNGLAVRLGSAVAKRRQFIAYCRDHRNHLGQESAYEDGEKSSGDQTSSKATTFLPKWKIFK